MATVEQDNYEHARKNARGWYSSIEEMLDNLKNWQEAAEAEGWTGPHKDKFGATYFRNTTDLDLDDNEQPKAGATWACATWKQLCEAHDIEPDDSEEGRQTIEESVLSVLVRDGWRSPGAPNEDGPEEYEILLTTGGPALRIHGKLDQWAQPETAEMQMQDWYVPWERWPDADRDILLAFASCFYFGE